MSPPSLPERDRAALADLLAKVGPDAPTCCEGWTTAHLAAHLVVRDSRPDASPGFGLERFWPAGPLTRWSHRLEDRLRAGTPYGQLVDRVRSGPPAWSPVRLPALERAVDSSEFAIHHEDVRRAQPGWQPRALPPADQDRLWSAVKAFSRAARRPLLLRRSDAAGVEQRVGSEEAPPLIRETLEQRKRGGAG